MKNKLYLKRALVAALAAFTIMLFFNITGGQSVGNYMSQKQEEEIFVGLIVGRAYAYYDIHGSTFRETSSLSFASGRDDHNFKIDGVKIGDVRK
jgi:hypothetical protein